MESNRNKKVTIKALNPMYRDTTFFAPIYFSEETGSYRTGLESPDVPQAVRDAFKINEKSRIPIQHNETLFLDKDHMFGKYLFIRNVVKEVSPTLHDASPAEHLFYIDDPEEQAVFNIDKQANVAKAYGYVSSIAENEKKLHDLAFFVNINPMGKSHNVVLSALYKKANDGPTSIIKFFQKGTKNLLFVRKLLHAGVITKTKGSYYDGETFVGHNEAEAVNFVSNPDNSAIVDRWGVILNEKHGITVGTEESHKTWDVTIDGETRSLDRASIVEQLQAKGYEGRFNVRTETLVSKLEELSKDNE